MLAYQSAVERFRRLKEITTMILARYFFKTGARRFPRSPGQFEMQNGRTSLGAPRRHSSLLRASGKMPAGVALAVAALLCTCLQMSAHAQASDPASQAG